MFPLPLDVALNLIRCLALAMSMSPRCAYNASMETEDCMLMCVCVCV